MRARRPTRLPPPFLKRIFVEDTRRGEGYPFDLPLFANGEFELVFERPTTILVGENGSGKSTLLEAIAVFAGFDDAGGGKGYRPVDHSKAIERSGGLLAQAMRGHWLPKITDGWFFRAESFYSVARYLDLAAQEPMSGPPPDFLSHSHGEGFLRFFDERMDRPGLFLFDEPEAALSPSRQIEFLRLLRRMESGGRCQILIATHSPLLMSCPGAMLLKLNGETIEPTRLEDVEHFKLLKEFFESPESFMARRDLG